MGILRTCEPTPTLDDWFRVFATRYRYVRRLHYRHFGRKVKSSPKMPKQGQTWELPGPTSVAGVGISSLGAILGGVKRMEAAKLAQQQSYAAQAAIQSNLANQLSNGYDNYLNSVQSQAFQNGLCNGGLHG